MTQDTDYFYLLRRLSPTQWNHELNEPNDLAFRLRPVDKGGLSVYLEGVQTPRSVLQLMIDSQKTKAVKSPERVEKWFELNGSSVEVLVNNFWRVARVPKSAFPSEQFTFTMPNLADGHLEILGTQEAFETYTDQILSQTLLCTLRECME